MSKYNSVDIVFHFEVNADTPSEARKQANEQLNMGAMGTSICNSDTGSLPSISNYVEQIQQNPTLKELAEITHTNIYDEYSLESAIEKIMPTRIKKVIRELEEIVNDANEDYMYKEGCMHALELVETIN